MSLEIPDQKVWIRASREILEQLRSGWSPAVRVRAIPNADGSWEMSFRAAYNEKGEVIDIEADDSMRD